MRQQDDLQILTAIALLGFYMGLVVQHTEPTKRFMIARRTVGYSVGFLLIAMGVLGFAVEISEGKASSTICAGYVMAATFLSCGIFLLLAVWTHYRGGFWSASGGILVASATMLAGFFVDMYLRDRNPLSFRAMLPVALPWFIGCYCLVWGHMRHHRKKRDR